MSAVEHFLEGRLGPLPEGLGVGRWRWNIASRTIEWSPELRRIYGLAETDRPPMSLSRFAQLVHPDDRARVMSTVSETLASSREGHEHRFRVVRPDGGVRVVLSRAILRRDGEGRASVLEGVDVDLTADLPQDPVGPDGETLLRAVFDAIDQGFCICEMIADGAGRAIDYRFLETNRLFVEMTGLSGAVGRTALELVPDLERDWIETYARVGLGRETLRFQQGSDAMGRWFDVFATPLEPHGRFALVFRDITAKRDAERALAESEARFRHMADNAPVMVWVTEADGTCSFLSRSWYDFTGQDREAALRFGWLDAVHEEDRPTSERVFREACARREAFGLEYRLRRADGVYRWVIDAAKPRLDDAGAFLGYIGSVIDITERREAEAAQRESEERARSLFENAGVSLWDEDFSAVVDRLDALRAEGVEDLTAHLRQHPDLVRDLVGRVVLRDVNAYTLELFGAPDKETLLASLATVFPPGAEAAFLEELSALWRGERFTTIEGPLCTVSGESFDALVTLVFDGQRAERTLVSVVDVSHRVRFEERQQTLIDELNHRVKNSLATVQAIATQTFRGDAGPDARDRFSARLRALAEAHNLLTQREWRSARLCDVVDAVIAPYEDGASFTATGPSVVLAPRQVLSFALVLHELCTNAIKYGARSVPDGRVEVSWDVSDEDGGRRLRLVWKERGGPPVVAPTRSGFGSRLIGREMTGTRFAYDAEGLTCFLDVRLLPLDGEA